MQAESLKEPKGRLHPEAERLLRDYRSRLERALRKHRLPEAERREVQQEIESHLRERLARLPHDVIEPAHVLDILYKLGEPESYVPLYLTQSDLARGLRGSFGHLLRGYGRWLRATATQYVLSLPFVLSYLLSLLLIVVGFTKLIFPEGVHVYAVVPTEGAQEGSVAAPKERSFITIGVSLSVPPAVSGSEATDQNGPGTRRIELLSPMSAVGLLAAGIGIALFATWLLRRLLRRVLLQQYGI